MAAREDGKNEATRPCQTGGLGPIIPRDRYSPPDLPLAQNIFVPPANFGLYRDPTPGAVSAGITCIDWPAIAQRARPEEPTLILPVRIAQASRPASASRVTRSYRQKHAWVRQLQEMGWTWLILLALCFAAGLFLLTVWVGVQAVTALVTWILS